MTDTNNSTDSSRRVIPIQAADSAPDAAQAACVPGGALAVFGGTPPACSIKITAVN